MTEIKNPSKRTYYSVGGRRGSDIEWSGSYVFRKNEYQGHFQGLRSRTEASEFRWRFNLSVTGLPTLFLFTCPNSVYWGGSRVFPSWWISCLVCLAVNLSLPRDFKLVLHEGFPSLSPENRLLFSSSVILIKSLVSK